MAKSLLDEMGFGKHKRESVADVIKNDTPYMTWLIEERIIELDNEAFKAYQEEVEHG